VAAIARWGGFLRFSFVLLEPLLQRLEFLARARQHRFLNFELLSSYEIQLAEPGGEYRTKIFLKIFAHGAQPFRHRICEFARKII